MDVDNQGASDPLLTFVVSCKGRLSALRQSLPTLTADPRTRCVVVDYDCPEGSGAWASSAFPEVTVVSAAPVSGFNKSCAWNLGAAAVVTPWVCFTDADILWQPGWPGVILPLLLSGRYLRVSSVNAGKGLCGTVICQKIDFERAGGYDEAFRGWGIEDEDFFVRLRRMGLEESTFPAELLRHLDHPDTERNSFHGGIDIATTWLINFLYAQVRDLIEALLGEQLVLVDRQVLHHEVARTLDAPTVVAALRERSRPTNIDLVLDLAQTACAKTPRGKIPACFALHATLDTQLPWLRVTEIGCRNLALPG